MGAKKRPFYRVVVADSRSPRDGRVIETIGHYNPLSEPATVVINADRASYWLSVGAQPTEVVTRLMRRQGIDPTDRSGVAPSAPEAPQAAAVPGVEPTAVAQAAAQGTTESVRAPAAAIPQDTSSVTVEPSAVSQQEAQTPADAVAPAADNAANNDLQA